MIRTFLLFCLGIVLIQCNQPSSKEPHILVTTDFGDIELELYPEKAPKTVAAFLSYIDSGYFNKAAFYRVLKTEGLSGDNYGIIQGGRWQTDSTGPSLPGIEHESTRLTGLSHKSGTLSLARTKPGTANTEFFICIGDQTQFDHGNENGGDQEGFAAFGKVVKGMKVVRSIQDQPYNGDHFTPEIRISSIKRL